jgi:hypothetical protein
VARISASTKIEMIKEDSEKFRYISIVLDNIAAVVNGNVEFLVNMRLKQVSVTFTATNTDTSVAHGLGFLPSGYIIIGSTAAMSVYDGSISNTVTTLTLRASATGTVRLLVF